MTIEDIALHDTEVDKDQGESVRMKMDIPAQAKATGFSEEDIFYFILNSLFLFFWLFNYGLRVLEFISSRIRCVSFFKFRIRVSKFFSSDSNI
jgi:hypothetical protein